MKAFFSDEAIKQKYIARVDGHIKADNLVRGQGWESGRGCAVGCTLEGYNHKAYETELGIPEWLAHLEDKLFENMTREKSKTWPKVFLEAIAPGVDLESVKSPFLIIVLEHALKSLDACGFDQKAVQGSRAVVLEIIRCHKGASESEWEAAREAAWAAARAAASEASGEARAAAIEAASAKVEVARTASRAAEIVAWSAREAADAASTAADAALWAAASAVFWAAKAAREASWPTSPTYWSEETKAHDHFADELLKLLRACPGGEA